MGLYSSDYGSGSSTSSSTSSWLCREKPSYQPRPKSENLDQKSSSYLDLMTQQSTLNDVMREFQMNGSDSPYNPDEDRVWARQPVELSGLGPCASYLRQKSWPAPERSPAARLPRPHSPATLLPRPHSPAACLLRSHSPATRQPRPHSLFDPRWDQPRDNFATSTPVFDDAPPPPFAPSRGGGAALSAEQSRAALSAEQSRAALSAEQSRAALSAEQSRAALSAEQSRAALSDEQARALLALPDAALYSLLRGLRAERRNRLPLECRFCKNNGERQAFYRSHALKDGAGRVTCPVLRAFTCRRCGARGDRAHTIKYCPLSTNEERIQSAGMMRSVRMASGRRRHSLAPSAADVSDYVVFGEPAPSVVSDNNAFNNFEELDPLWAQLEQKLSLY